jgi:hypothetical protein
MTMAMTMTDVKSEIRDSMKMTERRWEHKLIKCMGRVQVA